MSDLEIPVFGEVMATPSATPTIPEKVLNPRRKGTWALTPKGMFEDETCDYLIALLRNGGSNAIILNEKGVLEFGVVYRHEPQSGGK